MLAGTVLLATLSLLGLGLVGQWPTYPVHLLLPAFLVVGHFGKAGLALVVAITPVLFLIWTKALFSGSERIPQRSLVLLGAIVLLSICYFILSWDYGLRWQGRTYTVAVASLNALIAVFLAFFGGFSRRHASFPRNYTFHLSVFAWLSILAFPTLGELP